MDLLDLCIVSIFRVHFVVILIDMTVILRICLDGDLGRKIQANAEASSDELVDPPKVEEKIGGVSHSHSTDSDVVKRFV